MQEKTLPALLEGRDVVGQGRTGTGKTVAFLLGTFAHLLRRRPKKKRTPKDIRALVIAPTRELVVQIAQEAERLGRHTSITQHLVFGGVPLEKQTKGFVPGLDLLIGTPGRLIDFARRGAFGLRALDVLVIDEADRMFDLGFIRDLRWLLKKMPPPRMRQTMLFSATLSPRTLELAYAQMREPLVVRAETGSVAAERIDERVYFPAMEEKIPLLVGLLRREPVVRAIVFTNEKRTAEEVAQALARYGFPAGLLSGDVRQRKRLKILEDLQTGAVKVLVATDVASRGLHIPMVSHVFNFDLPEDPKDYVHRIGRTARAGATGTAISFACEKTAWNLPAIEEYVQHTIPRAAITDELVDIGEPTHPDAVPAGLGKDKLPPRSQGKKPRRKKRARR
ncbi:MAG: DEAD/DEAH box helicase [Zetaproteobacteria bacterium]|nr:MAG: DEAD/DEAH box helicase [Zetaproteobacteria bacterium]